MKSKIFSSLILSILALVMLVSFASAAVMSEWALTLDGSASNVNSNINAGTFTSSGVIFNAFGVNGANAEDWELTNTLDASKYFGVTISPQSDYTLTITDINFDYSASIIGPASFEAQYSKQTSFGSPTILVTKDDVSSTEAISSNSSLNIQVSSGETLTLRWFGYNFNTDTNEFRVKNLIIEGAIESTTEDPEEIQDCVSLGMPSSDTDVRIKKIDLTNNGISVGSFGSSMTFGDDESWFPFETIEAEIGVKNYGDYDTENVEVSWGVWDTDADEWVIEPDSEKDFKLDHGDTETITISFTIDDDMDRDLDQLDDGSHYKFYAYLSDGVVDDSDSPDDGKDFCAYDSQDTEMVIERDFVILNNIQIPETVQCSQTVTITADVWNIGDRDQDDVSVEIYNKELGLSEEVEIGNIDAFENGKLDISIKIPSDAGEKTYSLKFTVYDEDNDVYKNDYDDDESIFNVPFKVEGNCGAGGEAQALISASLESGGKAGQELVVKATIINTGSKLATYGISATRYSDWASSANLGQSTVILNAGESRDVLITLNVNKDVSGEKMFEIILTPTDGEEIIQPVSVSIEKSGFDFGDVISGSNWYLWLIGALNLILVIIIIVVAVKVMRK